LGKWRESRGVNEKYKIEIPENEKEEGDSKRVREEERK
jgi:hypothetical protein